MMEINILKLQCGVSSTARKSLHCTLTTGDVCVCKSFFNKAALKGQGANGTLKGHKLKLFHLRQPRFMNLSTHLPATEAAAVFSSLANALWDKQGSGPLGRSSASRQILSGEHEGREGSMGISLIQEGRK